MPRSGRVAVDLGALEGALEDLTPALEQIGVLLVAGAQRAFREQGRGERWQERRVPNVFGIVSDLARGKTPPKRRFDRRPALVDTGQLRNSIDARVSGRDTVEVGTVVPYASLHQFGGTSTARVTPAARRGLARYLKTQRRRRKNSKASEADRSRASSALEIGWLFQVDVLEAQIPARPFIEVTDTDREEIRRIVLEHVLDGGA